MNVPLNEQPANDKELAAINALGETIDELVAVRPLSAIDVTRELRRLKLMPDLWTVLDVADFMKERYSK